MQSTVKTPPFTVIHIPHASTIIPADIRRSLILSDEQLQHELLLMTDRYTDELFMLAHEAVTTMRFPVSRLVVDPERFVDDECEPMAIRGMGAVYIRTSDGNCLRASITQEERVNLLRSYYWPHHQAVGLAVQNALEAYGKCCLIDAHSFSSRPLAHETDQSPNRCDVCIGTDEYHTPATLAEWLTKALESRGFAVALNRPFSGTFVPMPFYRVNDNVISIMIEINRSLYMDEKTGKRLVSFGAFQMELRQILLRVATTFGKCGWRSFLD